MDPKLLQEQRRAILERAGEHMRSTDSIRAMSSDLEAAMDLCRACRATCYAIMDYLCYMPYDAFPDSVYGSVYECYVCCDLLVMMMGRESKITGEAAELCAAACRECAGACTGSADAMLQACLAVCEKQAASCDMLAAPGEGEEGRHASAHREEIRSFQCEMRSEGDGRKIVGYPILFNELSQDLGGFRERILPDAIQFAEDVRADFNHNPDYILGRTSAATLTLSIDARGVRMEADAPETAWANDLLVSIKRGDIDQGSFAFRILPGGQKVSEEGGEQIRTLTKILVRKVSVVSDPAYTQTSMQVRSKATVTGNPAGQAAPPAQSGGLGLDLLRRKLQLAEI